MDQLRLSVNIVAWNSMAYLPSLFESLEAQNEQHRIILVDNASTDGVAQWLTSEYPGMTVLRNMRNYGFTRAHNQAIQLALSGLQDSDLSRAYILICNPDIVLDQNCIFELVSFMDSHLEIDSAMPKLLKAHLRPGIGDRAETEKTNVIDSLGIHMTKARRAYDDKAGQIDEGQYDKEMEIFGPTGACAFYRASALVRSSLNGQFFDEDFHSYKEDVDVAWRMRRMGMKSALVPKAVAWHYRRVPSSPRSNVFTVWLKRFGHPAFVTYLSSRNHIWVLAKNLAFSDLLWHGLWILPYEIGKMLAALFSWSSLKGYGAALAGLPKMLKKRKELKAICTEGAQKIRPWFV
ncbi:MAG: glycosyltransferase family 2 protein [Patescibacteria group bacterium]